MPLPGMAPFLVNTGQIIYGAGRASVNPWVELGSPTGLGPYIVVVGTGAELISSGNPTPALTLSFPAGAYVKLINLGTIGGAGGAGGDGDRGRRDTETASNFVGGGGGGGAGFPPGVKGVHAEPSPGSATDGGDGTATTGGAAGANDSTSSGGYTAGSGGEDGGDAILITTAFTLEIVNASGLIVAGSRGGRGGYHEGPLGSPENEREPFAGSDRPTGIQASSSVNGYAIKNTGGATIIATSGVNSSNVKGVYVGPTSS